MTPADRCDRIVELIDRVLANSAIVWSPKPTPIPVKVREPAVHVRTVRAR